MKMELYIQVYDKQMDPFSEGGGQIRERYIS